MDVAGPSSHLTSQSGETQHTPPPMSVFINNDEYRIHEMRHAGWVQAVALMAYLAVESIPSRAIPTVLELGPGPGTSTPEFVKRILQSNAKAIYHAIDIDDDGIRQLREELAQQGISGVETIVADATTFVPDERQFYNIIFSMFSLSHLNPSQKQKFLSHAPDALIHLKSFDHYGVASGAVGESEGGYILITDEFLPGGLPGEEAYWKHHGAVIFDALIKGNDKLAELELEALYSGLHAIGDFKLPCQELEHYLEEANLTFRKFKVFPEAGDISPYRKDYTQPQYQQACRLWAELSPPLLAAALKRNPDNPDNVSNEARLILRGIFQEFVKAELTDLLPTLLVEHMTITPKIVRRWEVTDTPEKLEDAWGVYTYMIGRQQSRYFEGSYI